MSAPKGRKCHCKEKVYAETAIPAGIYKITMQHSPKFKRILSYLHDVPHFLEILIYSDNDESRTGDCILVGKNTVKGNILESRATLDKLNAILNKEKEIIIEIV